MYASQPWRRTLLWSLSLFLLLCAAIVAMPQVSGQSITKAPIPMKITTSPSAPKMPEFQSVPVPVPPTPSIQLPPRLPVVLPPRIDSTVPPVNQIDLTPQFQFGFVPPGTGAGALEGVKQVDRFPGSENARDGLDIVTINAAPGAKYNKSASHSVEFEDGEIIVSVQKPSRVGFVRFSLGEIAMGAGTILLIKKVDGVYRVTNFTGLGEKLKIKLTVESAESSVRGQNDKVISLATGYELIVGACKLKRSDIRIADGCARRQFQAFADGKVAVCEICTQTVLTSSAIIASMVQTPGDKSGRILSSLSKMAAVLNNINGTDGYTIEPAVSAMVKR